MTTTKTSLAVVAPGHCRTCAYVGPCGGLDEQHSLFGCFVDCAQACVVDGPGRCDYTCPKKPGQFARRWFEVGGWPPRIPTAPLLNPAGGLPRYIPVIRHPYRREMIVDLEYVALPTFEMVGGAVARYGPRATDGPDLRSRALLRADSKVLFVSVARDEELEKFWHLATERNVPARLTSLNLWAMTTPNFSYFLRAPRTHILHNTARILRCAEALSAAEVPPILHLNWLTDADWQLWVRVLRAHPQVRFVCKEFQTGGRDPRRAGAMIEGLRRMQDRVEQDLHPIIVGGTQYATRILRGFPSATFVDSRPFMCTVARRRLEIRWPSVEWVPAPTEIGEPLDSLLAYNLRAYARYVDLLAEDLRPSPSDANAVAIAAMEDEDQLLAQPDLPSASSSHDSSEICR